MSNSNDATLVVAIDDKASDPASQISKLLESLDKISKHLEDQVKHTTKAFEGLSKPAKQLEADTKKLTGSADDLGKTGAAGAGEWSAALGEIGVALAIVGTAAAAVVGGIMKVAGAVEELWKRYQKIDESQDVFRLEEGEAGIIRLERMLVDADKMGQSLSQAREQAIQLVKAFQPEDAEQFAKIIADLTKETGKAKELADVFAQLGVRESNIIKLKDFNQLADLMGKGNVAEIHKQLAKQLGVAEEALDDLIKSGKVSVTQFLQAAAAADLAANKTDQYGQAAEEFAKHDIGMQVQRVKNSFTELGDSLAKALFDSDDMATAMGTLSEELRALARNPQVQAFIKSIGDAMRKLAVESGPYIVAAFNVVSDAIDYLGEHSKQLEFLFEKLSAVMGIVFNLIAPFAEASVSQLIQVIDGVFWLVDAWMAADQAIDDFLASADQAYEDFKAKWGVSSITEIFSGDKWRDIGTAVVDGLIEGITQGQIKLEGSVTDLANGIVDNVKKTLGIASPSQVMMELGGYTTEGFAVGMDRGSPSVAASAADVARTAPDSIAQQSGGSSAGGGGFQMGDINVTVEGAGRDASSVADAVSMAVRRTVTEVVAQMMTQARGQA